MFLVVGATSIEEPFELFCTRSELSFVMKR